MYRTTGFIIEIFWTGTQALALVHCAFIRTYTVFNVLVCGHNITDDKLLLLFSTVLTRHRDTAMN